MTHRERVLLEIALYEWRTVLLSRYGASHYSSWAYSEMLTRHIKATHG